MTCSMSWVGNYCEKDAIENFVGGAARLSASPYYSAQLPTTCTSTMLKIGHAPNALAQTTLAFVNCRILPRETPAEVQAMLVRAVANAEVKVTQVESGKPGKASPLTPMILTPVEKVTQHLSPGVPVIPRVESGATDGALLRVAGIPTYGVSGIPIDVDDERAVVGAMRARSQGSWRSSSSRVRFSTITRESHSTTDAFPSRRSSTSRAAVVPPVFARSTSAVPIARTSSGVIADNHASRYASAPRARLLRFEAGQRAPRRCATACAGASPACCLKLLRSLAGARLALAQAFPRVP